MSFELAIVGLVVVPLAAGSVAFVVRRIGPWLAMVVALLELPLALRLAGVVANEGPLRYQVGGWGAPLGIDLYADGLSVVMLVMTALVATAMTFYAMAYFGSNDREHQPNPAGEFYWPLNLLLWASLNALFVSSDIFNLYVTLELLTLSAVALIGLAGTVDALAAALRYLLVALVASLFYLLGVALLYNIHGTVDWKLLGAGFQSTPAGHCAIVLICVGLLLKTALFPLHFWLPAAHANAPAPASALLSALVLKASFFVLLRLWFEVFPQVDVWKIGHLLGVLGAAAILWGSAQAIRQQRLKLLVAYSTVAQIGYLFLVFSLAVNPSASWQAWSATAYFALSHACAKAAAFAAAGSLQYATGSDDIQALAGTAREQPVTIFAFGVAGVTLMGLPPSGAFLAKWMLLGAALDTGQWGLAVVMIVGGLLAAIYVLRVVARSLVAVEERTTRRVPWMMQIVPLVLALVSLGLSAAAFPTMYALEAGAPFPPASAGETR